ncbi:MAG: substrate-binding domain-containing protein [Solobacterium sp.]|nr:substrate-binding domain-containing protein [Solobacterium sp.]
MKAVGMIVPTMDNSFFASLVHAVSTVMNQNGYTVFACDSHNDAGTEKQCMTSLCEKGALGIICVSGLSALPEDLLPADYPLVWVDRVPESERVIPWAANDDARAMKDAVQLLAGKGCRNILLLPGYLAEHQESPRVRGYREALEENGIPYREEFILNRTGTKSSETETEELVMNILRDGTKVDGIIASSDRAAFGALKAIGKVGYYAPEDVRLISFDNSPYSLMASPSITAIDRNPAELASKACELILGLIDGKSVQKENTIDVSLIERDSTR